MLATEAFHLGTELGDSLGPGEDDVVDILPVRAGGDVAAGIDDLQELFLRYRLITKDARGPSLPDESSESFRTYRGRRSNVEDRGSRSLGLGHGLVGAHGPTMATGDASLSVDDLRLVISQFEDEGRADFDAVTAPFARFRVHDRRGDVVSEEYVPLDPVEKLPISVHRSSRRWRLSLALYHSGNTGLATCANIRDSGSRDGRRPTCGESPSTRIPSS